jgi:ribosomal protein S18 acetylase RimI-like enzyme
MPNAGKPAFDGEVEIGEADFGRGFGAKRRRAPSGATGKQERAPPLLSSPTCDKLAGRVGRGRFPEAFLDFSAESLHIAAVKNDSTGPGLAAAMSVRDATPADLDGLVALENRCFEADRLSRRSFRKLIGSPTASLRLVARAGRIAGYTLLFFRAGSDVARLYSVAVDPVDRGTGLGPLLLADCETTARARGLRLLRLEVREDNAGAIRLYERLGYHPIGRYPDYYADNTDALRFEKRLREAVTPAPTVRER